MMLALDAGNTNIKIALFDDSGNMIIRIRLANLTVLELESYVSMYKVEQLIWISTRKLSADLLNYLRSQEHWIEFTEKTAIPIKNLYGSPKTLGRDRLVAVIAAHEEFGAKAILVIDAGTCITYDFINAQSEYLGGAISPGLNMRFRAMHEFTGKLPLVQKQRLNSFIGYNTESSLQVGACMGLIHEIEGFIQQYEGKFGEIIQICTGGDTQYLVDQVKSKIFARPNLILFGLFKILIYNVSMCKKQ